MNILEQLPEPFQASVRAFAKRNRYRRVWIRKEFGMFILTAECLLSFTDDPDLWFDLCLPLEFKCTDTTDIASGPTLDALMAGVGFTIAMGII